MLKTRTENIFVFHGTGNEIHILTDIEVITVQSIGLIVNFHITKVMIFEL